MAHTLLPLLPYSPCLLTSLFYITQNNTHQGVLYHEDLRNTTNCTFCSDGIIACFGILSDLSNRQFWSIDVTIEGRGANTRGLTSFLLLPSPSSALRSSSRFGRPTLEVARLSSMPTIAILLVSSKEGNFTRVSCTGLFPRVIGNPSSLPQRNHLRNPRQIDHCPTEAPRNEQPWLVASATAEYLLRWTCLRLHFPSPVSRPKRKR